MTTSPGAAHRRAVVQDCLNVSEFERARDETVFLERHGTVDAVVVSPAQVTADLGWS